MDSSAMSLESEVSGLVQFSSTNIYWMPFMSQTLCHELGIKSGSAEYGLRKRLKIENLTWR